MSFTTNARNDILDALVNAGTFDIGTAWISLHYGDPGDDGSNEISSGDYSRAQAQFGAASNGSASNDEDIVISGVAVPTSDDKVTHVGIWDSETSGTFMAGAALDTAIDAGTGDETSVVFRQGDLTVELT